MYVCICKGVTEQDIHQAVQQGVSSLDELSNLTSVSSDCGCCQDFADQVLQKAMSGIQKLKTAPA